MHLAQEPDEQGILCRQSRAAAGLHRGRPHGPEKLLAGGQRLENENGVVFA